MLMQSNILDRTDFIKRCIWLLDYSSFAEYYPETVSTDLLTPEYFELFF